MWIHQKFCICELFWKQTNHEIIFWFLALLYLNYCSISDQFSESFFSLSNFHDILWKQQLNNITVHILASSLLEHYQTARPLSKIRQLPSPMNDTSLNDRVQLLLQLVVLVLPHSNLSFYVGQLVLLGVPFSFCSLYFKLRVCYISSLNWLIG